MLTGCRPLGEVPWPAARWPRTGRAGPTAGCMLQWHFSKVALWSPRGRAGAGLSGTPVLLGPAFPRPSISSARLLVQTVPEIPGQHHFFSLWLPCQCTQPVGSVSDCPAQTQSHTRTDRWTLAYTHVGLHHANRPGGADAAMPLGRCGCWTGLAESGARLAEFPLPASGRVQPA